MSTQIANTDQSISNDATNAAEMVTVDAYGKTYTVYVDAAGNVDTQRHAAEIDARRTERDAAGNVYRELQKSYQAATKTAELTKKEKTTATRKYNAAKKNGTKDTDELKTVLETVTANAAAAVKRVGMLETEKAAAYETYETAKSAYIAAELAYNDAETARNHVAEKQRRRDEERYAALMEDTRKTANIATYSRNLRELTGADIAGLKKAARNTAANYRQKITAYNWQIGKTFTESAYEKLIDSYPNYAAAAVETVTYETDDVTGEPIEIKTYHNAAGVRFANTNNAAAIIDILRRNPAVKPATKKDFAKLYAAFLTATATYHEAYAEDNAENIAAAAEKINEAEKNLNLLKSEIQKQCGATKDAETVTAAVIAAAEHELNRRIENSRKKSHFANAKVAACNEETERRKRDIKRGTITACNEKHKTEFKELEVTDI